MTHQTKGGTPIANDDPCMACGEARHAHIPQCPALAAAAGQRTAESWKALINRPSNVSPVENTHENRLKMEVDMLKAQVQELERQLQAKCVDIIGHQKLEEKLKEHFNKVKEIAWKYGRCGDIDALPERLDILVAQTRMTLEEWQEEVELLMQDDIKAKHPNSYCQTRGCMTGAHYAIHVDDEKLEHRACSEHATEYFYQHERILLTRIEE